jgi:hypothetical protein
LHRKVDPLNIFWKVNLMDTYVTLAKKNGGVGFPSPETTAPVVPAEFSNPRKPFSLGLFPTPLENPAIWHYEAPSLAKGETENDGVLLKNLRCKPSSADRPMVVCESIFWRNVKVRVNDIDHILPLTEEFKALTVGVSGGDVDEGSAAPWSGLGLKVDSGFDLEFRFRFSADFKEKPKKVESEEVPANDKADDSMSADNSDAALTGKKNVFILKPNDIIVTISFVSCKQSENFTPRLPYGTNNKTSNASPLSVARFFPITIVRSRFDLELIDTATHIMRPPMAVGADHRHDMAPGEAGNTHIHADEDLRSELPSEYDDDAAKVKLESGMLNKYSVSMYSDNNLPIGIGKEAMLGLLAPTWEKTFSSYHTSLDSDSEYLAVLPRLIRGEMIYPNVEGVRVLDNNGETVYKCSGQGLFDNIHIAPMMTDSTAVQRLANNQLSARGFDAISMAPFCVHDCLHTHWRWSSWSDASRTANRIMDGLKVLEDVQAGKLGRLKDITGLPTDGETSAWNRGWSAPTEKHQSGLPYTQGGSTMIPANQIVSIKLKSTRADKVPHGFVYQAKVLFPERDIAHVFFHHGSAYSAYLPEAASAIAANAQPRIEATLDPGFERSAYMTSGNAYSQGSYYTYKLPSEVNWARFYWNLRYQWDMISQSPVERIGTPDWKTLNELPLLNDKGLIKRIQDKINEDSKKNKVKEPIPPLCNAEKVLGTIKIVSDEPSAGTGVPASIRTKTLPIDCAPPTLPGSVPLRHVSEH